MHGAKSLKTPVCILLCGAALVQVAGNAETLEIPAGVTHTVEPDVAELRLDRLEMGRGAVLRIPPGSGPVSIHAASAAFGAGSRVDARGRSGPHGVEGRAAGGGAPDCEPGRSGTAGTAGSPGKDGRAVRLSLGISRFEGLTVDASGGAGGRGGNGGAGSTGGNAKGCHGGDGGRGAAGGSGGHGGRGGDIELRFWVTEPGVRVPVTNYGEGVTLRSNGGAGGPGGSGGAGGAGGKGRYEKRSSGKTIAREAGRDGAAGQPGTGGLEGPPGRTLLEVIAPEG